MAASKSRRLKASINSQTAWTFSFDIQLQYRVTAVSDARAPALRDLRKRRPQELETRAPRPTRQSRFARPGFGVASKSEIPVGGALHDLEVVSRRDPTDLLLGRSSAGKRRGKIAHVVLPASRSVEVQEPDRSVTLVAEGVDNTRGHADKAARLQLERLITEAHGQRPLEDIEHVVQTLVSVRGRAREPPFDDDFAEIKGIIRLFAGGLDGHGRRSADPFALTRPMNGRVHLAPS